MHVLYKGKIFPAAKKKKLVFKLFKEKNSASIKRERKKNLIRGNPYYMEIT